MDRIYLSPPHIGSREQELVADAFASNWIAPLGPHVDAFEREFAEAVGAPYAVALSSGTAALHLALIAAGVGPGDVVLVSTLTFAASVNPIVYLGATPHFIDSERESWNMDPALLRAALEEYAAARVTPKAVVVVHLYGQSADMDAIAEVCAPYGVPLIEDAAEALGATYRGRSAGTMSLAGIFSFNGNKIITTSGGGMLVTADASLAAHVRKLATQAREPVVHYEHRHVGYNYRLSNILAAVGRAQLEQLAQRVAARRKHFEHYVGALSDLPGIAFMPDAGWGTHTRWLSVLTLSSAAGVAPEELRLALESERIEARPVWMPMHRQPVFAAHPATLNGVADDLFACGLCLPSGSDLRLQDIERVVAVIRRSIHKTADISIGTTAATAPR